ncbi:hypothetical protein [Legionella parisiensis]|uniref:Protein kinase domain-containing protein n=1 Tax=Legionella parisiensis TaxID=45071 RepID=A0A1E5JMD1_9GAMM|nr:hypothetical protein [Legionella parisiensis]KTD42561.1 serine/threonine protein kinase [Legionella parisiensis]OEH45716.1 hypothetical protein lpari_03446 [Legionella parisiensis]STX71761.1 serine/threonine protein kinase [Legionella parisiensis]
MFAKITGFIRQKPKLPPKREMQSLTPFEPGALPPKDIERFTTEINILIDNYNLEINDAEKRDFLKQIQTKIQEFDCKYRQKHFAESPAYREAHAFLFKEIQHQYASLGVTSLVTSPSHSSPLSELIANMSPEKADKLLDILVNNTSKGLTKAELVAKDFKKELVNLYEKSDKSPEAEAFRKFLKEHEISYLGGGNSKNFKITNISDNSELVLKVDYRLSMPRNVETHLREKLQDRFIPLHTDRMATCLDRATGDTITRSIQVTEYCGGGSVVDHRQQLKKWTEVEKFTGDIFEQMARTLLDIQEAGCMFPDSKLTNWLIDDLDQVQMGDTKSFVFTDEKGKYRLGLPQNAYGSFLDTKGFRPPEFDDLIAYPKETTLDADAVHAYILGKNLYIYAAGKVPQGHDGAKFDFTPQIFSMINGPAYKELIVGLVNPDPAKRMPVREALDRLFLINNPEFKDVFTELKALKFGKDDKMMRQYINEKQELINGTYGREARQTILLDLQRTVSALKAEDGPVQKIRSEISKFREGVGPFTVGKNAKAERIEREMSKLSVEERLHFFDSPKSQEVMKALASHRHWGKGGKVYFTENHEIDSKKAAKSFQDFKKQFHEQIKPKHQKAKEEDLTERDENTRSIEFK